MTLICMRNYYVACDTVDEYIKLIFLYMNMNMYNFQSLRIVTAAYSSKWFSGTEGFKRGLQIVMTRAHRPFTLTAGNIMLLSLDTFVQVRGLSEKLQLKQMLLMFII